MGWKILVNGQELKPDTIIDKSCTIKFTFINDTGSALDKVELTRKGDRQQESQDRFIFSIYTKLPAAKLAFGRRAYSETFGENNLSVFDSLSLYAMDLPEFFVILREVDPSIGEVISVFFTHSGLGFEANKLIQMEILTYLIWQNKISDAITSALAQQNDQDQRLVQFGRLLQQACAGHAKEIPYKQVINFYTAIDVKHKYYKQAMQELYQFCMGINTESFSDEEKKQLLTEKFRAALLSTDASATRFYQELSGIGITSEPPEVNMQFTAAPEPTIIDALIAIAEEQRKLREPLKEAGKAVVVLPATNVSVISLQATSVATAASTWKIVVNDNELSPDAKLDKDKDYRIHLVNDDGKSAITTLQVQRWGDKNKDYPYSKYAIWLKTKNARVMHELSKLGYQEELSGDEIEFRMNVFSSLSDLACRFVALRKIEPAIGDAMIVFFTHNGIPIGPMPLEIRMDMLVQLIEKNKIDEAVKAALARQEEKDFSVIQFGRILEHAYDDSKGSMSYQRVVEFYLGVTAKCVLHPRAMQALYQFCSRVEASTLSSEQQIKLQADKFRAALLIKDDSGWRIFYDLCGGEIAAQTMNAMKITAIPELSVANAFAAIALQIRALRAAMQDLQKEEKQRSPSPLRALSIVGEERGDGSANTPSQKSPAAYSLHQ